MSARCSKETLINGGITGPMLRAAGVNYDIRKVDSYGIYDRFNFRIPLGEKGDCYDRIMIRFLEMRESLKILRQALDQLPEGQFIHPKAKIRNFKPPVGEAYGRIEGPKGELGFHLISDGTTNPTATASARRVSSISRCSKTCASASIWRTWSSFSAASTSC